MKKLIPLLLVVFLSLACGRWFQIAESTNSTDTSTNSTFDANKFGYGYFTNRIEFDNSGEVKNLSSKILVPWITDVDLERLKEKTRLTLLDLSGTRITNAGLVHLRGMTNLEELTLDKTKVTDAGLVQLKWLVSLKGLSLENTNISDAGLVHLKEMTSLVWLNLMHSKVTDPGAKELQAALPKCNIYWK